MNKRVPAGDDFPKVETPVLGICYHISWAWRGCYWQLVKIEGDTAHMITPKTRKQFTCKVSDLRMTHKHTSAK